MKAIYIIAITFLFMLVYVPESNAQGFDWGIKPPTEVMESQPLNLESGTVAITQFPAIEMFSFGPYTAADKEEMPNLLGDLNKASASKLKELLIDIRDLNYKISKALDNVKWKTFILRDLKNRKSASYKLMSQINSDLKKLHLKYADLLLSYEQFFDAFFMFDDGTAFRPGDLRRSLWGGDDDYMDVKDVINDVALNAKRGEPSPIMKWIVYYMDRVIPSLKIEAARQPRNLIRTVDPLWSLKQDTYSDDFDIMGNFWTDVMTDPRMFGAETIAEQ